jgi:hypothetical protein
LQINDTVYLKGQWKYYDTGNASIIELENNQCQVGIKNNKNYINILNPHILLRNDNLSSLSFISIANRNQNNHVEDLFINLGIIFLFFLVILLIKHLLKKN